MRNRAKDHRKKRVHSKKRIANENLGDLKIQDQGVEGREISSRDFPDMSGFESMSYKKYFADMKAAPLDVVDRCQTAFFSLDTNFLRQRYELMALIYGFATIIRDDEAMMASFREKPFWKDYKYKGKNVLRMVFQYCLMTSQGDLRYHRACAYARGLAGFFNDNVPMEQIPDMIEKAGGIEILASPKKMTPDNEDARPVTDEEGDSPDNLDNTETEKELGYDDEDEVGQQPAGDIFTSKDKRGASSSGRGAALKFGLPKLVGGEYTHYLHIAVTNSQLSKTLRRGKEEEHEVQMTFTVSGKEGEFRQAVAKKVRRLDE